MNADSFENETASARSDTEPTVTNEAQAPKIQVLLPLALIGVYRRPSAVPEGLGSARSLVLTAARWQPQRFSACECEWRGVALLWATATPAESPEAASHLGHRVVRKSSSCLPSIVVNSC
jgi:hypothetical protein